MSIQEDKELEIVNIKSKEEILDDQQEQEEILDDQQEQEEKNDKPIKILDDVPDITKDFEEKLKSNAIKEKNLPPLDTKEDSDNEDIELTQKNSFFTDNWLFIIIGFFVVVIIGFLFFLFKSNNNELVEDNANHTNSSNVPNSWGTF